MLELYAPHKPRSDDTTRTPARFGSGRSTSNGWSRAASEDKVVEHRGDLEGVGPVRISAGALRLADARRRDQLLGLGDLLDRPRRADPTA